MGLWSNEAVFSGVLAVRVFGPYQTLASGMAAGIVLRTVSWVRVIKGLYSLAHKQTSALHEFTPSIVTVSSRFGLQTAHLVLNRSVCSQCDSVCVCVCAHTNPQCLFASLTVQKLRSCYFAGGVSWFIYNCETLEVQLKLNAFRPFILPAAVFLTISPSFHRLRFIKSIFCSLFFLNFLLHCICPWILFNDLGSIRHNLSLYGRTWLKFWHIFPDESAY